MKNRVQVQIETLSVEDILYYFASIGWVPTEHRNSRIWALRSSESTSSSRVDFIVPRSRDSVDFVPRVSESIESLGELMGLDPVEIIRRIVEVRLDVICARVISIDTARQSLPLDAASVIVNSLTSLMVYGASGECSALPFFKKPVKLASKHAHQCRFGHTFDGSFGFTIESPVQPSAQSLIPDHPASPPFERRVVERIYRGLELLESAVKSDSARAVVEGFESGFNANMCDALLHLRAKTPDLTMDCSVRWSPTVPRPKGESSRTIHLGEQAFSILERASKDLRQLESAIPVTIEGRVVMLKSDSPPWEDEVANPHTVVIAWLGPEGTKVKTRVILQPNEYLLACNAHTKASNVAVDGLLEKRGNVSRLSNPTNFRPARQMSLLAKLFEAGES